MTSVKSAIVILASALALSACSKQGADPAKVQADVAKAQADGEQKVADAQAKLERIRNDMNNNASAPADTRTPTTGTPPTSVEAPGSTALPVDPAQRLADAQFSVDKAKAEQAYNVAVARCEDRVDEANKACRELAKSQYDAAMAQAKSKNKSTSTPSGNSGS